MSAISLRQVSVLTPTPLFQNLTFTLGEGDRLGVIAGNGAGKSTLLRCLTGTLDPTHGSVVPSRGLRTALVAQDMPPALNDLTLREVIRRALPADRAAEEWRVDVLLDDLGATHELHDRPVRALSGGWQRLALIARAWISQPDLLLLDEPTNHLDVEKIRLLERWLSREAPNLLVVASHDRDFLDACTNRSLFLRPETSRSYAHAYSVARPLLVADDAAAEAKLTRDSREVTRLQRSAAALRNIGLNSRSDAAQKKSAQMAQRAHRLEQELRPIEVDRTAEVRLAGRGTHARVLLMVDNLAVAPPEGAPLFHIPHLTILRGDRIVVLGRNGVGKSLLVQRLHSALTMPNSVPGVRVSAAAVVGFMDQAMSQLPGRDTPFHFVSVRFGLTDQRCRSVLAGAGFPVDRQLQPIDAFSPGQRARLGLLALRLTEPTVYVLDEPTNHLDIPGRETLESEIVDHAGTSIMVSHDRRFVRTVGTRFLLIEGEQMREIAAP